MLIVRYCTLHGRFAGCLYFRFDVVRGDAGKSLARPRRKQATATKLGIYSTYTPRSLRHFLARCFIFCKPLKKIQKFVRPTRSLRQRLPPRRTKNGEFTIVFQAKQQVVVRRGQIRITGWVIKTLEAQVGQFLLGCKCPVSRDIFRTRTRHAWWISRDVFPSKCPSIAPAEMNNTGHW